MAVYLKGTVRAANAGASLTIGFRTPSPETRDGIRPDAPRTGRKFERPVPKLAGPIRLTWDAAGSVEQVALDVVYLRYVAGRVVPSVAQGIF